ETLARPVPADRSGCVDHWHRRLSGRADLGFRGAKLDPAACVVAAPTAPAQPGAGGTALTRAAASRRLADEPLTPNPLPARAGRGSAGVVPKKHFSACPPTLRQGNSSLYSQCPSLDIS